MSEGRHAAEGQGSPPVAPTDHAATTSSRAGRYVARPNWSAAWSVVLTLAILSAAAALATLLTLIIVHPGVAARLPGRLGSDRVLLTLALMLMAQLGVVAATLAIVGARGPVRAALALHRPAGWLRWAVAAGTVAFVLVWCSTWAMFNLLGVDVYADLRPWVPMVRSDLFWTVLVVVAVGAPLSEELLFRGFLLPALATRMGFWPAALIANAGWTALHLGYSTPSLLAVFIGGIVFSLGLRQGGTLWVTIVAHAIYNGAAIVLLRFVDPPPPNVFGL